MTLVEKTKYISISKHLVTCYDYGHEFGLIKYVDGEYTAYPKNSVWGKWGIKTLEEAKQHLIESKK